MTPSPLTASAKLEAVRAACVQANPEIVEKRACVHYDLEDNKVCSGCSLASITGWGGPRIKYRPIHLADVLLAIGGRKEFGANFYLSSFTLQLYHVGDRGHLVWNLRSDSLDAQSPKTLDFLFSLLCNEAH